MNPIDTRSTRIAVFIDFDNVEIGVKSTIGGQFDIGLVLEAIKERGEIVTKIAYSDWKRAGDYSRVLTQHAIRMVQRNLDLEALTGCFGKLTGEPAVDDLDIETLDAVLEDLLQQGRISVASRAHHRSRGGANR